MTPSRARRHINLQMIDDELADPGVDAICGLSLLLVLSFAPRSFSLGTTVFPSPQKPTFPNSSSTRNQVDEEPLCGCAISKSLFIYLFKMIGFKRHSVASLGGTRWAMSISRSTQSSVVSMADSLVFGSGIPIKEFNIERVAVFLGLIDLFREQFRLLG